MTDRVESSSVEEGLRKPLLITSGIKSEDEEECDESEESPEDSHRPANSFRDAYRLLTPSVKVSSSSVFVNIRKILEFDGLDSR